jgi:hypothetical protein
MPNLSVWRPWTFLPTSVINGHLRLAWQPCGGAIWILDAVKRSLHIYVIAEGVDDEG